MSKKAIIIGAGPAGLTAAYELLKRTDIKPIILEKSGDIGGISKTINYKGNRMDIGGHRFFSKSDRVMKWWMNIMPIQKTEDTYTTITYQRKHHTIIQEETHLTSHIDDKKVMLIRKRLSRIYFLRKFFTYPIQLSLDTLKKLGLIRTIKILLSYLYAQIVRRKPEKSLEDFMINRFGRQLYLLFFKDYTEKVWGVACHEISAEWGAQRIKGISISKAIQHAAKSLVQKKKGTDDIAQKGTETSLIEQFLYPALGPGQLWEEVARQIEVLGGTIVMNQDVKEIKLAGNKASCVVATNSLTGEENEYEGDYFFSTMPVQELIAGMNGEVPQDVKEVAAGLQYRDFITVGVLLQRLASTDINTGETKTLDLKDTWIYIQEKDVKVGRLQLFNNWSPYMVNKPDTVWIGMEYFCNKGDEFWNMSDEEIQRTAIAELEKMGLAQVSDVLDSTVQRVEKTYPAYFGTYDQFDKIRAYVDQFENLFLVGRNGMHKYNNSDHSMLTAMVAVDNICEGVVSKESVWEINTEMEYHEEKASEPDSITAASILVTTENTSFKDFLFKNKRNKKYLWYASIAVIIQFIIFKYWYPFPSFIHDDSFVYLKMANDSKDMDIFPIGYPRFLSLFGIFTRSDTALVAFQYLLIQCSALFLVFTIFYFYKPAKPVQWTLLAFIVLNPLFLHLANLVSSDGLFLALSCTWFTLLLWIINRPSTQIIVLHSLVLLFAFTVRYNSLIYPLIAVIAFGLSPLRITKKILGVSLAALFCGLFILYTGNKYKQLTGKWQFSPFSGWQLASNAMVAYQYVDSADRQPVPKQFHALDSMVRLSYKFIRAEGEFRMDDVGLSTYYMWMPRSPLRQYMEQQFGGDTVIKMQTKWATIGPLYGKYGGYLIKTYPIHFAKYYLWLNASRYYAPPVEFLQEYNGGKNFVKSNAKTWFGYKSRKIKTRLEYSTVYILTFYPILSGVINVLFLCCLLCFLMLRGFREKSPFPKLVGFSAGFWLLNAGFTIFASPAALRFQSFPIIIVTIFTFLLVVWMVQLMASLKLEEKSRNALESPRLELKDQLT